MGKARENRRLLQHLALAALAPLAGAALGCTSPRPPGEPGAVRPTPPGGNLAEGARRVRPGIEVLLAGDASLLRGRRVGLITNHTGVGQFTGAAREVAAATSIDLLHQHPGIELVALYSPEHGVQGQAQAGAAVASGRDAKTGLPIYSLYAPGGVRKPTAAMLEGVEVLAFDIQDIGARYYTYVWTMALAMQAAAEHGIRFVVLDRPNPIGGELVQGNVLEAEQASFVGLYPVPMRHGLTPGELARLIRGEFGVPVELTVVPAQGWRRGMWFEDTGLPWIPPSPNMPSVESATHYPGTCLFEGTNLSVGRGTPIAFQQIGAPWLDAETVVRRLEAYRLPGVRLEAVSFTPQRPGDGKYDGEPVRGVRFLTTDRRVYDPTVAAVAALVEVQRLHPDRLEWRVAHFDRLAGTTRLREQVAAGVSLEEITAGWAEPLERFRRLREKYLIYPN